MTDAAPRLAFHEKQSRSPRAGPGMLFRRYFVDGAVIQSHPKRNKAGGDQEMPELLVHAGAKLVSPLVSVKINRT
jgi:hypothetical protein